MIGDMVDPTLGDLLAQHSTAALSTRRAIIPSIYRGRLSSRSVPRYGPYRTS
jgi:hypothetical protein